MPLSTWFRSLRYPFILGLTVVLVGQAGFFSSFAAPPQQAGPVYPVCRQPSLVPPEVNHPAEPDYSLYFPAIRDDSPPLPPCTVYCGLRPLDDPYQPPGYNLYFADEFDCDQLLDYWVVQGQMTAASYTPPPAGYTVVDGGTLKVGVTGPSASFPYLYLVDDGATTYDIPYTTQRVDWLPETGAFRLAMRVRFVVKALGEHRIAIYADGHRPAYAGPLFYIGSDYNGQEEAWRGLIAGTNRGNQFVDLGDQGYPDPYTGWVVVTADFDGVADRFTLSVDGLPRLVMPLSSFKGYPAAATRPDILYLGSLALLENPTSWTGLEVDWLRVYVPASAAPAAYGLLTAQAELAPVPGDSPTPYSAVLPPGPFANTPYWSEHFDAAGTAQPLPDYWQLVLSPDPGNAWTELNNSQAALQNNGRAARVPVWAIFDDMLPATILSVQEAGRETPADYLQRRGGSPFSPGDGLRIAATYPRFDWRPNGGNIRYAWRARQTANGYGVEISNAGHFPYFTGSMFYTLVDTTSNGGKGQFILPSCQEQYFWRLERLPGYTVPHDTWTIVTADYINGTVHLAVDGQPVGWWPESDCSLNWYLKGENATSPDVLFFGNPASAPPGSWSQVFIDWFATFPGLARVGLPL